MAMPAPPPVLKAKAMPPVHLMAMAMPAPPPIAKAMPRPPKELNELERKLDQLKYVEEKCMAMPAPPPIDHRHKNYDEEDLSRLVEEMSCEAMPAPPPVFKHHSQNNTIADTLFKTLRYFIVWFDPSYPYGEYTGYQEYMSQLFAGVPYKIENDYSKAVRQLNKNYANTKYILIASGRQKKKISHEIHSNASVEKIYVIKPFIEKIQRWGNSLNKVKCLRDFKELVEEIKKSTETFEKINYRYPIIEKLLNYQVVPDHMLMSEQTVRALRDEISQEEDQMKFNKFYTYTLQILKRHFADSLSKFQKDSQSKYLLNPFNLFEKATIGVSHNDLLDHWVKFLDLAIYFDGCKYVYSGTSIDSLKECHNFGTTAFRTFLSSSNKLAMILRSKNTIDEFENSDLLTEFHKSLFGTLSYFATLSYENSTKWQKLYIIHALLYDIDLCIKLLLSFLFENSNDFGNFHYDLIHSATVSDTRVSCVTDLLDAWKEQYIPKEIAIPDAPLKKAIHAVNIKNIVLMNDAGIFDNLISKLPSEYKPYKYYMSRDFLIDVQTLEEIKYGFCYFVISPAITSHEYNTILDTCISNAITPIFILYIPVDSTCRISKEMMKGRWTVTLIYCNTFDQIIEYITECQNNINRDLLQYSKCYSDFKGKLQSNGHKIDLSKGSKGENDAGWEVMSSIGKDIFSQLVEELSLGTKLVGSLHYYMFLDLNGQGKADVYWNNYAPLFGISNKYTTILDINCAKTILRAYTLQTTPAFYKMLNDSFRSGNPETIAKYRAFFSMLHDEVKKGILKKHVGFVYRGTYFNPDLIETLQLGQRVFSSCFTSTSKSEYVAREFANKAKRNVLLELELDAHANSNVDIHAEKCSRYPEEQEVLLLPFASFEIKRIFKEDHLTLISLKEIVPDTELINLKGIEYTN